MSGAECADRGSRDTVLLFLRLGTLGFGGPAAHIALMHDEVVTRRRWMTKEKFLDLLGATNLIPGPNSTEMAMHIGYERAGWRGLALGGVAFIAPTTVLVLALAWLYREYGSTPAAASLLYGVEPVVIAIVLHALVALVPSAMKTSLLAAVGVVVLGLYLAGMNEIVLLFGGGATAMALATRGRTPPSDAMVVPLQALPLAAQAAASSPELHLLFFVFLKIGALLYGSGYVLLAFLRGDVVERLGWLTDQQLIEAVTAGQITPGPVLSTATFVGYLVGGWDAGLLATVAIFLPSFVFVAVSNPVVSRLRRWGWAGSLVDGVNVAAVALMAGVSWELGRHAIVDVPTGAVAVVSLVALVRFRLASTWLMLAGACSGLLITAFR